MSYAEDERAAFVTRQGMVITWSWDGHATEIDMSTSLNAAPRGYDTGRSLPGVVLHPNHPHTLYLASIARSTLPDAVHARQRNYIMIVVRYEHGTPVHRFTERIAAASLSGFHHPSVEGSFTFALPCSKMSSSGLYNMGTLLMPSYGHDIPRVVELASVGFNVLTESFIQRAYVATQGSRVEVRGLHHFDAATWGLSRDMQHMSTWVEEHGSTTRWFDLRNVDVGAAKRRAVKSAVDVSGYMRSMEKVVSSAGPCRVYGDEDFQVFVTKWGVLVWAFTNTELRERVVGEESVAHAEGVEPVRSSDLRPLAT